MNTHERPATHATTQDPDRLIAEAVAGLLQAFEAIVEAGQLRQPRPDGSKLLSVREASIRLGVSRTTTYQLVATGELRTFKVRGRRLVPASAIDDFIAERGSIDAAS